MPGFQGSPAASFVTGAVGETRTLTPFGTAPSRQRVYQFHHDRVLRYRCCEDYFGISVDFAGSPDGTGAEGAGAAGLVSVFFAAPSSDCVTPPDLVCEAEK